MRCTIPEISWHNREPVLSVDIHPLSNEFYRLASGGGDSHILIWQMSVSENGSVKQEVVSDLNRHQKAVNTVRWSSSGQYLASADDDANIIVWQLKNDNIPMLEGETDDKEVWIVHKVLRGHKEDIYDLCWSVDDSKLFSGSIDNTAILWDLTKGKMDHILSDHKGFVQGVAWDPKNQFLATICTDRICRFFDVTGKHVKARIHKGKLPVPPQHFLFEKESKYFHDDTFKSFFRRLQFTPDGSLLIVPSGHIQADDCKKIMNATLVFTMDNWNEPAAVLPLPKQCSTVVRCCPILFEHHDDGPEPLVKTPYRMIFAVGADHDVILYDTQQAVPFAWFHQIHYTRLTDLTWSKDGLLLVASSTDGFCALITFEQGELGKPYVKDESDVEENPMDVSGCSEILNKDENVDINNKLEKEDEPKKEVELKKKPSFIAQWVQNTPKKSKVVPDKKRPESKDDEDDIVVIVDDDNESKVLKKEIRIEINRLIPTRKTSTNISASSGNQTVAKPIEVRRKPRDVEAKPIAVRRKPREPENTRSVDNQGISNTPVINKEVKPGNTENTEKNECTLIENNLKDCDTETNTDKRESFSHSLSETDKKDRTSEHSNDEQGDIVKIYVEDDNDPGENPMNVSGCLELPNEDVNVDTKSEQEREVKKEIEIKKKTSFIAQWVQKTPTNIKVPDKKVPRSKNSDNHVVEIIDDDEDSKVLKKEIRIEINRLIPRRKTQANISASSVSKSVAKPIEVRRKPRDVEPKPIAARKPRHPENSVTKSNTDIVNAVPVNKETEPKTTENAEDIECNSIKNKLKDCDTETINLQKSENLSEDNSKKGKKKITLEHSGNETTKYSNRADENEIIKSDNLKLTETTDAKRISVCGSAKQLQIGNPSSQSNKTEINTEIVIDDDRVAGSSEDSKNENGETKQVKKVAKNLNDQWGTSSDRNNTPKIYRPDKEFKATPSSSSKKLSTGKRKREETPKVKVGSLVRKKLKTDTPPKNKNNPLLNFLKSSGGKKKRFESEPPCAIEMDLTTEEARDAWGKDSKLKTVDTHPEGPDPEEDCTEDFSLQLEDSQDDREKKVVAEKITFTDPTEVDREQVVLEESDTGKMNENSSNSVVVDISDDSNDCTTQKKMEDHLISKVPRRVSLITLSSPKDKKKQSKRELP